MITVVVRATGESHSSFTFEQSVGKLWKSTWMLDSSPGEYMQGVASRAKTQKSAIIRTNSAENFLHDLEAAGFINIDEGSAQ